MSIFGEKWSGLIYPILLQFIDAYTMKNLKCLIFAAALGSTLMHDCEARSGLTCNT